jgi:hypothetical protein
MMGKQIYTMEKAIQEGFNSVQVETTSLPEGIYFLEIQGGGVMQRSRFLISR